MIAQQTMTDNTAVIATPLCDEYWSLCEIPGGTLPAAIASKLNAGLPLLAILDVPGDTAEMKDNRWLVL
jgi:hypothetical protein